MKAIVLCGGKGTRLRPYTQQYPKPMLKLGKKPILEYVVYHLKKNGIEDLIFSVGYLKDQIIDYFGDGSKFGVNIEYSVEEEAMNTAGAVGLLRDKVKDTFIVTMGDHLTDIDLRKLIEAHRRNSALATIALKEKSFASPYGIVEFDESKRINKFREKPLFKNYINIGIYALEPQIFEYIKGKEDFSKDIFPRLIEENKKIYGHITKNYWIDVGRVNDYEKLNEYFSLMDLIHHLGGF